MIVNDTEKSDKIWKCDTWKKCNAIIRSDAQISENIKILSKKLILIYLSSRLWVP